MADPITLGFTALAGISGMGSALIGASGARRAGQASSEADQYNAIMEMIRAQTARQQAGQEATVLANEGRAKEATAAVAMGESGIDSTQGSSAVALNALRDKDTLDVMTRIYTGEVEATGHVNEALMNTRKATYDAQAGGIGAGAKLLGGVFDAFRLAGGLKFGKSGSTQQMDV